LSGFSPKRTPRSEREARIAELSAQLRVLFAEECAPLPEYEAALQAWHARETMQQALCCGQDVRQMVDCTARRGFMGIGFVVATRQWCREMATVKLIAPGAVDRPISADSVTTRPKPKRRLTRLDPVRRRRIEVAIEAMIDALDAVDDPDEDSQVDDDPIDDDELEPSLGSLEDRIGQQQWGQSVIGWGNIDLERDDADHEIGIEDLPHDHVDHD
jgi:hypothetical protein